jgi:hypothetical protein
VPYAGEECQQVEVLRLLEAHSQRQILTVARAVVAVHRLLRMTFGLLIRKSQWPRRRAQNLCTWPWCASGGMAAVLYAALKRAFDPVAINPPG